MSLHLVVSRQYSVRTVIWRCVDLCIPRLLASACQHVHTVDLPLDLNPSATCTICRLIPSKTFYRLTRDSEHLPEIAKLVIAFLNHIYQRENLVCYPCQWVLNNFIAPPSFQNRIRWRSSDVALVSLRYHCFTTRTCACLGVYHSTCTGTRQGKTESVGAS